MVEFKKEEETSIRQKICLMVKGSTMLKAGRLGKPHFRNFRLSDDLKSLSWESPNKDKKATQISIKNIHSLLKGQKSKVFETNVMPEYESKSFSVLYKCEFSITIRSLDIVCAHRIEYEIWSDGLNALIAGFNDANSIQELKKDVVSSGKVQFDLAGDRIYIEDDACDVYTWGGSPKGTLGHGEEEEELVPRAVKAVLGKDVQMVACGTQHTMVLTKSGEVYSWGSGRFGKLGLGNILDHYMPLKIQSLSNVNISFVACGENHSAVVSSTGILYTFGHAGSWLGYELNEKKQTIPKQVEELSHVAVISKVSCGSKFTIALTSKNELFTFGENHDGQLGFGHNNPVHAPIKVEQFSLSQPKITEISCGKKHVGVVTEDGVVWVWGANDCGQLGLGDTCKRNSPTAISTSTDKSEKIVDIKCGGEHSIMLSDKGKVICFGDGQFGQLGVDLRTFKKIQLSTPLCVPSEEKFCKIDCGAAHSAAITESGSLFVWGRGVCGCLGLGDHRDRFLPTLVESLAYRRIESVSCGTNHTAACVIQAWIKDEEVQSCMACKLTFSVIRRRHHCRKCGGVFCYACTQNKIPILEIGHINPVLVCDPCYLILSEK